MKLTLKWPVVIITFILTFSLIYGANYWRQQNLVMEPLREELLSLEMVEGVQIEKGRNKKITVLLGRVPNLALAYQEIEAILQARNEEFGIVVITDRRDEYLSFVWEQIHLAVMEGERQGNYTQMNKEISLALRGTNGLLDYAVYVDQQRIYLALMNEEAYLYEIIPIKNSIALAQSDVR